MWKFANIYALSAELPTGGSLLHATQTRRIDAMDALARCGR